MKSARYGIKIRKRIREIEKKRKKWHKCPNCGYFKVKRKSAGIWECKKCGTVFAGGAYEPTTDGGIACEKYLKGMK
jgi:large subunit ribosomal protein L37Ae